MMIQETEVYFKFLIFKIIKKNLRKKQQFQKCWAHTEESVPGLKNNQTYVGGIT